MREREIGSRQGPEQEGQAPFPAGTGGSECNNSENILRWGSVSAGLLSCRHASQGARRRSGDSGRRRRPGACEGPARRQGRCERQDDTFVCGAGWAEGDCAIAQGGWSSRTVRRGHSCTGDCRRLGNCCPVAGVYCSAPGAAVTGAASAVWVLSSNALP
jgi:hypothetical protein